jgi:hypothetical protein
MVVLPARPFIRRVSYPTLVSTLIPGNRSFLEPTMHDAANDLDVQSFRPI